MCPLFVGKITLPDSLPMFLIPDVPLNLNTLMIILPYSAGLAVVGLLESMMTATIVDDLTDTPSDKNRECKAQGVSNICTAFIGGMAGCAMIGQSIINIKSGGRGRLSTLTAGALLLCMVVFLNDWVCLWLWDVQHRRSMQAGELCYLNRQSRYWCLPSFST